MGIEEAEKGIWGLVNKEKGIGIEKSRKRKKRESGIWGLVNKGKGKRKTEIESGIGIGKKGSGKRNLGFGKQGKREKGKGRRKLKAESE